MKWEELQKEMTELTEKAAKYDHLVSAVEGFAAAVNIALVDLHQKVGKAPTRKKRKRKGYTCKKWTKTETDVVKAMWDNNNKALSVKKIHKSLKWRTKKSIQARAYTLGLTK